MFVLDSSVSLSSSNFQSLNEFLIRIVTQYQVSRSSTQVGLVTFGGSVSAGDITIGSIPDRDRLIQAIRNRPLVTGSGRRDLHVGLRRAYEQINSLQSTSSNVVVVITTGLSADPEATVSTAQLLHSVEDIEVFVISVNSLLSSQELLNEFDQVISKPRNNHVFELTSFQKQSFNTIFGPLVKEFCDGKGYHAL